MSKAPSLDQKNREDSFQHTALEDSRSCIRLVRFLRRGRDKSIRLEIRNSVRLDHECPPFIALSYEWGHPNPTSTILLKGRAFTLRENLHLFLDTLYKQHRGRTFGFFWADAICIDQTNVQERNHQVQQMKQIYQQASRVLAWVGPSYGVDDGELALALRTCYRKEQQYMAETLCGWYDQNIGRKCWSSLWHNVVIHSSLIALCKLSFWSRVWIVQELVLACELNIIWSSHNIDLKSIVSCVSRWNYIPNPSTYTILDQECRRITTYLNRSYSKEAKVHHLTFAISYFGDFACSVFHDKVYGLLGLDDGDCELSVDYNVSIEDLFINVLNGLDSTGHLDDLFNLAEVLHISFDIHEQSLRILHRGGQEHATGVSPIVKPSSATDYSSPTDRIRKTPPPSISLQKLLREERQQFIWDRRESTGREDWTFLRLIIDPQSACCCSLCSSGDWKNQRMPSDPARFLETYEWYFLSGTDWTGGKEKRQTPHFNLLFSGNRYFATLLYYPLEGPKPPFHACILFHDPFHDDWVITDGIGEPASGKCEPTKRIEMPMMSALIAIAHATWKKDRIDPLFYRAKSWKTR